MILLDLKGLKFIQSVDESKLLNFTDGPDGNHFGQWYG